MIIRGTSTDAATTMLSFRVVSTARVVLALASHWCSSSRMEAPLDARYHLALLVSTAVGALNSRVTYQAMGTARA